MESGFLPERTAHIFSNINHYLRTVDHAFSNSINITKIKGGHVT